jgi:hypothetical protein
VEATETELCVRGAHGLARNGTNARSLMRSRSFRTFQAAPRT